MSRSLLANCGGGRARCLLSALLLLLIAPLARAHPEGFSGLQVHVQAERVRASLTVHTRDTGQWFPPSRYPDYVAQVTAALAAAPEELLEVAFDADLVHPTGATAFQLEPGLLQIDIDYPPPPPDAQTLSIWSKHLPNLPRGHQQLLFVHGPAGQPLLEAILSTQQDSVVADLPRPGATTAPTTAPAPAEKPRRISFFRLGIEHIVTGYDHLLFLAALLLVCTSFREAATVVTFFTVAHSITLSLAALDIVRLPDRLVEPAIAASIVYVGLENLFGRHRFAWRALVTFLFGLVHGLGFAGVLREIGLGTGGVGIAGPLLKFSIGLETGQLVIAAVLMRLMLALRDRPLWRNRWVPGLSIAVALIGGYWLVVRLASN